MQKRNSTFGIPLFTYTITVNSKKGVPKMRSKMIIGAIACGAVIGSAAAAALVPCCSSARTRRKMIRYKNRMVKTVGSVMDAVSDLRR